MEGLNYDPEEEFKNKTSFFAKMQGSLWIMSVIFFTALMIATFVPNWDSGGINKFFNGPWGYCLICSLFLAMIGFFVFMKYKNLQKRIQGFKKNFKRLKNLKLQNQK